MTPDRRPAPFCAYTTPEFWDDPHISEQLLRTHLDPDDPQASRPAAFLDRSVRWIVPALGLTPGSRVLDLGCGPGLYAHRLARRGITVLGVDVSRRSLAHAREVAEREALPATFRRGSYLDCDLGADHDAAILVYEDYCALSPDQRAQLLGRVHAALRPGGRFLFDVTSSVRFAEFADTVVREADLMGGFWAEPPYTGTWETWTYPELRLVLDRYEIETATRTRRYWLWTHCLTPDEVRAELTVAGFGGTTVHGDVAGAPYARDEVTFAVLARRP